MKQLNPQVLVDLLFQVTLGLLPEGNDRLELPEILSLECKYLLENLIFGEKTGKEIIIRSNYPQFSHHMEAK